MENMHGVSAPEAVHVRCLERHARAAEKTSTEDTRSVYSVAMTRRVYATVRQFHRKSATRCSSVPSGASESASTDTKKNAPEIQNVSMSI